MEKCFVLQVNNRYYIIAVTRMASPFRPYVLAPDVFQVTRCVCVCQNHSVLTLTQGRVPPHVLFQNVLNEQAQQQEQQQNSLF